MNSTPFVRQYGILNNKWGAVHSRHLFFFVSESLRIRGCIRIPADPAEEAAQVGACGRSAKAVVGHVCLFVQNRDVDAVLWASLPPERDVRCKAGQSRKLHKLVKGHVLLLQKTGIRHFPDGHLPPEPQTVPKQHGLAVERLHVKRLAAGQGMRRRQRKEEMLLPVFRAGYARLLDRMRQDDQLVNAVPQRNLQRRLQPLHRAAEGGLDTGKGHHDPEAPGIAEMLLRNFKVHD